jgi:hypothetical protein
LGVYLFSSPSHSWVDLPPEISTDYSQNGILGQNPDLSAPSQWRVLDQIPDPWASPLRRDEDTILPPCVTFSVPAPSHQPRTETPSCLDHTEDIGVVTVEEFLRRTTDSLKPTKVYKGKKKRRIVDLEECAQGVDDTRLRFPENEAGRSAVSNEPRHSGATSHQLGSPISPSPAGKRLLRRPRRHRTLKTLAERIFRAAVLSNANAGQIPESHESNSTSSRRPLSFVKENAGLRTPSVSKKRRTLTLVDPRRILPLRQATFSSQHPNNVDLTNRMLSTDVGAHISHQPRLFTQTEHKSRAKKLSVCVSKCPPLSFVPLIDAERIPTVG